MRKTVMPTAAGRVLVVLPGPEPACGADFPAAQRHPGPDIPLPGAAGLTGLPLQQARRLVRELTSAHLLTEHAPGRFAFHDLLRAYATEQARVLDSSAARRLALRGVLAPSLHPPRAAALVLSPAREPIMLAPPQPGAQPAG